MGKKTTKCPRFIMIGGFLGAGKTTTVLRLAGWLQSRGWRVGVVTNDQAAGLVDTALAEELDIPVQEIVGGCFCCQSESLVEALERLEAEKQPDIFIAEPVGSCTDLVATVSLPLRLVYGKDFTMAPYAVLVDPFRAEQVLGSKAKVCGGAENAKTLASRKLTKRQQRALEKKASGATAIMAEMDEIIERIGRGERIDGTPKADSGTAEGGGGFHEDVNYIYQKQLEEAEIIVINKVDLIGGARLAGLRSALGKAFPQARVMEVASRDGIALEPLFEVLEKEPGTTRQVMEVNYARYGIGEAMLGWVNGEASVEVRKPKRKFEADAWLMGLAEAVVSRMAKSCGEIAHLKLAFRPEEGGLSVVQLTRSGSAPEAGRTVGKKSGGGKLLLNLRAEADPAKLEKAVRIALRSCGAEPSGVMVAGLTTEAFRPGQPVPTHRVAAV